MKEIRGIGLIVLVVAVMALSAGTGSASASVLCSTNTSPCTGTIYGAKTTFSAKTVAGTSITWTTAWGNISCAESSLSGELTNAEGHGRISSVIVWPCTEPFGGACSLTVENLPWTTQATASGKGSGTFSISGFEGASQARIHFSCSTIDCKFVMPTLSFTGGNPAKLTAEKTPVKFEGALCPPEPTLDVEYEITSPKPAFVE